MHPLLFSFKRVYLRAGRFTRAFANEFQLTPARYDLLIAIARGADGIPQASLRHVIGVTKQVISRMLYQLEDLGLVRRTPYTRKGTMRWVRLTAAGATRLSIANSELMGPGSLVDDLVRAAVTRNPTSPHSRHLGYVAARRVTDVLRERLGDTATLVYPSYPAPGTRWPEPPRWGVSRAVPR